MNATSKNFSQAELDKFDDLAQRWWDPRGPQKALHALNPARLGYVAERVQLRDAAVLDVGCGGGLLSEALAQAGARPGDRIEHAGITPDALLEQMVELGVQVMQGAVFQPRRQRFVALEQSVQPCP